MKFFYKNYSTKKIVFFTTFLFSCFATLYGIHLLAKSNDAMYIIPIITWGIASYLWYKNYSNA